MYGLNEKVILDLQMIFATCHAVDQVILYGSRAKGNYKNGSDIDFTLVGEKLSLSIVSKLEE